MSERTGARAGAPAHQGTSVPAHQRTGAPAGQRAEVHLRMTVNGETVSVHCDAAKTLLEVLREDLGLTGTKHGCELGECGACAVLMDGRPALSCLVLAVESDGAVITTVEGLADGPTLHPLQEAFAETGAAQCGYCTPGMLVTAKHLLDRTPRPTRAEIVQALSGNLCRCTGYQQIYEAVEAAAAQMHRRTGAPAHQRTDESAQTPADERTRGHAAAQGRTGGQP
jgi:aerobic-type carbon monoxide dehydrogenase small subunit (CoxS/CutS family)